MKAKNRHGFGLLAVIFILLVFSVLAMGFVSFILSESHLSVAEYRYTRAFFIAEAGKNFAIKHISTFPDWSVDMGLPITKNFAGGTFTIDTDEELASEVKLYSVGLLTAEGKTYSQTIKATVTTGEAGISVSDWQEVY